MTTERIRRTSRGKRPIYFSDPAIDKLMAVVLSLVGELSVCRERVDALERILCDKGLLLRDEIEGFEPDDEAQAERDASRKAYIERVFRIVTMELQRVDNRGHTPEFDEALRNLLDARDGA